MNSSSTSATRRWFFGGILSLTAVLFFYSCAGTGGFGQLNLISESQELELGKELADEIAQQGELVDDPEVTGFVSDIGNRLVAVSARPGYPYRFHVLRKEEVNAFAIPGGHMYIQTGLILEVEREAELAGVMAHELGHAENRHGTQQLSRQYGLSLLTKVLLGEEPSQTQQIVSGLLGNITIMKYSRDVEREADYVAVHLLYRAGYDPVALADFFRKLKAMEERNPGPLESLFLSHPMTEDRIAFVEQEVRRLAPKEPTRTDNTRLVRIQERLRSG